MLKNEIFNYEDACRPWVCVVLLWRNIFMHTRVTEEGTGKNKQAFYIFFFVGIIFFLHLHFLLLNLVHFKISMFFSKKAQTSQKTTKLKVFKALKSGSWNSRVFKMHAKPGLKSEHKTINSEMTINRPFYAVLKIFNKE